MKILITGTAGFIGYHLANRLLERGDDVLGLDSINDYYDVTLKRARLQDAGIPVEEIHYGKTVSSAIHPNYRFVQLRLEDQESLMELFRTEQFDAVCNLAAQAGVRYSLENPKAYLSANIDSFLHLLEACRAYPVQHLVYASSSSVYGLNEQVPFSTSHNVDHPVSLYAASKKSNELMAHTYSHLFRIPTTGLRFFTVYGPWGRPDMALFLFTDAILNDRPIKVFNHGKMQRDFTYVDDIVEGVLRVIDNAPEPATHWNPAQPDPGYSSAPYRIYNIGNNQPVQLMDFIAALERTLGRTAEKDMLPMQPGDVARTYADSSALMRDLGYQPDTSIEYGIQQFVDWYVRYYEVELV